MRPLRVLSVVAALCLALPAKLRAGDTAPDPETLRENISHNVAAALAGHPAGATHVPAAVRPTSARPAHGRAGAPAPGATPQVPAAAAPLVADTTAEGAWAGLLAGNQRFVAGHLLARDVTHERAELAAEQHPLAIVLGCSDSRVSPELVFDQSLGQVFVVRTAGNIVDPIALGSIEYAVEHLHPKLLVVLGHGGCGAIKAAAAPGDMPSAYLQAIVDRIRPTIQRLSACFEGDELIQRSVIANARQSAADMLANSTILREASAQGRLRVMSAVYDLGTGVVTPVTAPTATAQATPSPH